MSPDTHLTSGEEGVGGTTRDLGTNPTPGESRSVFLVFRGGSGDLKVGTRDQKPEGSSQDSEGVRVLVRHQPLGTPGTPINFGPDSVIFGIATETPRGSYRGPKEEWG